MIGACPGYWGFQGGEKYAGKGFCRANDGADNSGAYFDCDSGSDSVAGDDCEKKLKKKPFIFN